MSDVSASDCAGFQRDSRPIWHEMQRKEEKMIRSLKALGLVVSAAVVMSVMFAAAAHANTPAHLTAGNGTGNAWYEVEEHSLQTFTTDVGVVECNIVTAHATEAATTDTVTTTDVTYYSDFLGAPTEEGPCEAFGQEMAFNFNGCDYHFTAGTWNGTDAVGTVDLRCPEGKQIEFITSVCTLKIPAQSGLGPVTYVNSGGSEKPMTVTIVAELENIEYSTAGLLCETLTRKNGVYEGNLVVRAYEDVLGSTGDQIDATVGPAVT